MHKEAGSEGEVKQTWSFCLDVSLRTDSHLDLCSGKRLGATRARTLSCFLRAFLKPSLFSSL